jgi:hypothetical protein
MIATWMVYCALCAAGLAAAATLAERVLLAGRGPVRAVWVGAIVLSFLVPLVAVAWPRPARENSPSPMARQDQAPLASPRVADAAPSPTLGTLPPATVAPDWGVTLSRFDRPLALAWMMLSLAVGISFATGVGALAWMRRRWTRRTVLGVPVLVSQRTGPAVVGVVSPAIVLPEWVLAMAPAKLALMLRHEEEHRRARDSQLLVAAQFTLVLMPWNIALWWQMLRLRVAVELDCDARVLGGADPRLYGDLLLEVARPQRGLIGLMAFAEHAKQLERRIRVLGRHRARTSPAARAVATSVGVAALSVAWIAPRPAPLEKTIVQERVVITPVLPPPPTPSPTLATRGVVAARAQRMARIKANATPAPKPDTAKQVTVAAAPTIPDLPREPQLTRSSPCGQPGIVDATFDRLFAGMSLTADQRARACDVLIALRKTPARRDVRAFFSASERPALIAARDSALRALVTNDADRALLETRLAQPTGGSRGGGGARGNRAPTFFQPDSASGRGRGGGGGRRGGGDPAALAVGQRPRIGRGSVDSASLAAADLQLRQSRTDATFRQLLGGITLTPEQEAKAREVIAAAQTGVIMPTRYRAAFAVDSVVDRLFIPVRADSALTALITNDADRATLLSRLIAARSPR